jgi:hypothetical protein
MGKRWSKEELDILKDNYGKIKTTDLQVLLPKRTLITLRKRASQLNLKWKDVGLSRKKYIFNEIFFDKPTIQNCCWAGFIAADGCFINKSDGINIKLSIKDICILFVVKELLILETN